MQAFVAEGLKAIKKAATGPENSTRAWGGQILFKKLGYH
jgi:hypothetical protein